MDRETLKLMLTQLCNGVNMPTLSIKGEICLAIRSGRQDLHSFYKSIVTDGVGLRILTIDAAATTTLDLRASQALVLLAPAITMNITLSLWTDAEHSTLAETKILGTDFLIMDGSNLYSAVIENISNEQINVQVIY